MFDSCLRIETTSLLPDSRLLECFKTFNSCFLSLFGHYTLQHFSEIVNGHSLSLPVFRGTITSKHLAFLLASAENRMQNYSNYRVLTKLFRGLSVVWKEGSTHIKTGT